MDKRTENVFVIRLWSEGDAAARGMIEHVETKRRMYFSDPNEVADLLRLAMPTGRT